MKKKNTLERGHSCPRFVCKTLKVFAIAQIDCQLSVSDCSATPADKSVRVPHLFTQLGIITSATERGNLVGTAFENAPNVEVLSD